MTTQTLIAIPLTAEAFAPYGEVIELGQGDLVAINQGTVDLHHKLAEVEIDNDTGGRAVISLAQANTARTLPARVELVERHPRASQAFIPLFGEPMIVVVGQPTENASPQQLQAFVSNGKQGVNYGKGVWHMPIIASQVGQTWIVVDRAGLGENCEEHFFQQREILVTT